MQDQAYLVLKHMESEGFDSNNYEKVLELQQTVPQSISKFLDNQYLLSDKVDYEELELHMMEGANGYITQNGIIIPKIINNEKVNINNCPSIDKFGIIIFYENFINSLVIKNMITSFSFDKDAFFGFILDKSEKRKNKEMQLTLKKINNFFDKCKVSHDSISRYDKEVYLIKRQN